MGFVLITIVSDNQLKAGNLFDNSLPDGGNYWSDYDILAQECY